MEIIAGFLIALAIGLTGVGGGTLTAPVLMLFFGVSTAESVTLALAFTAIIKFFAAPLFVIRKQVDYRTLGRMALGGIPGVIGGTLLLTYLDKKALNGPVLLIVGATVLISSLTNLFRRRSATPEVPDGRWAAALPWLTGLIGAEVGFSSAGAGALGTLVIMRCTTLAPVQVVGTDMLFGLILSFIGGGLHIGLDGISTPMLIKLLAGGIPGVLIGAQLAGILPARRLRMGLCLWLVYLGGQLLFRGIGSFSLLASAAK